MYTIECPADIDDETGCEINGGIQFSNLDNRIYVKMQHKVFSKKKKLILQFYIAISPTDKSSIQEHT